MKLHNVPLIMVLKYIIQSINFHVEACFEGFLFIDIFVGWRGIIIMFHIPHIP